MKRAGPARVVIVSSRAIHRDGLVQLLRGQALVRVVDAVGSTDLAAASAGRSRADVVLLDLPPAALPSGGRLQVLAAACAPARVVILAAALDDARIADALRRGVRGIVVEDADAPMLARAIAVVASGHYWLAPDRLAQFVQQRPPEPATPADGSSGRFHLTERELEIVSLLVTGSANRDIARACRISEKTVKYHLTNIFDKTGVSTRLELAVFALDHGLARQREAGAGAVSG